jgi:hypothetical protein
MSVCNSFNYRGGIEKLEESGHMGAFYRSGVRGVSPGPFCPGLF